MELWSISYRSRNPCMVSLSTHNYAYWFPLWLVLCGCSIPNSRSCGYQSLKFVQQLPCTLISFTYATPTKTPSIKEWVRLTWRVQYSSSPASSCPQSSIPAQRANTLLPSKCSYRSQCSLKQWLWFLSWCTWDRTVIPRDSPPNISTAWEVLVLSECSSGSLWSPTTTHSGIWSQLICCTACC